MKEEIIAELGANYNTNDSEVIEAYIQDFTTIAVEISNLNASDDRLFPYIRKAVISRYLSRGAEGLKSRSEGSISASYEDIINGLKNDLARSGLRRCY